ncbi:hypothetical protein [Deinococcus hohokamensis]|uniref:Uncharacterized protein n=1 Tax=Deinococcus hohokamensis TaxID=309883 RepID=A0ABV9I5T6_9DEIO
MRTSDELHTEGLRPVPVTPVGLWQVVTPTRRSISGLFDCRTAVPLEVSASAELE